MNICVAVDNCGPIGLVVVETPTIDITVTPSCPIKVITDASQGPQGPPTGVFAIVTESSTIPDTQIYTIVDGTGNTIQTLPSLVSVINGNITTPFTIANVGAGTVQIDTYGFDALLYENPILAPYQNESFTLLPTTLGWVMI